MPRTSGPSATTQDNETFTEQVINTGAIWSDDIPDDQVSYPVLSLIQSSGPIAVETKRPGWYHLSGFAPIEHPIIVPFRFGKARRYQTNDGGGQETHCYAPVGHIRGIAVDAKGPGVICEQCEFAAWTERNGRRVPPPCQEELRYLIVVADALMPAQLLFRSTAIKVGRQLAGIVKVRGQGALAIRLGSVQRSENNQVWHVPTIEVVGRTSPPELQEAAADAIALARELSNAPIAEVAEQSSFDDMPF